MKGRKIWRIVINGQRVPTQSFRFGYGKELTACWITSSKLNEDITWRGVIPSSMFSLNTFDSFFAFENRSSVVVMNEVSAYRYHNFLESKTVTKIILLWLSSDFFSTWSCHQAL